MKVVFRVDSSLVMGYGHIMRCQTLAKEFKRLNYEVSFICKELNGNMIKRIKYEVLTIRNSDNFQSSDLYLNWLGSTQNTDAMQSINVIPDDVDLLIVDNYALDEVWHKQLRRYTTKIMVIDDLANRSFDCDLLLNQNIASRRRDYKGKVSSNCQLMLGCKYAMLRDEFSEAREKSLNKRKQTKLVKNILVSMGGGDVDNTTYEILKHLNGEFDVTVVLSGASPHNSMVKSYAFNKNIRVVIDSKNMARLMFNADLAIGAGGSTSWERCCLGLPTLLFIMEENQRVVSEKLEEIGAAIVVRDFKHDLDRILNNPELWMLMSKKASLVCDGLGVKRIKI